MAEADRASSAKFWQSSLESLQAELRVDCRGLNDAEAAQRIRRDGLNILRPRRERALALQFLSRFGNPLIILLLAAATISAFTGDIASFVIITIVVVLSVTLDFVQEYRAGRAAERLKQSVALTRHRDTERAPGGDRRRTRSFAVMSSGSSPAAWCPRTAESSKPATSSSTRRC